MRKQILFAAAALCFVLSTPALHAQDWRLAGNSDASASSKLGTTNSIPLRLVTNNVERVRIDPANGRVGIGITNPAAKLTVFNNGSTPAASWVTLGSPIFVGYGEGPAGYADNILAVASGTANIRPLTIGRRARGTLASPAIVSNNDFLASYLASGYDGSTFQNPATIDFFVDGTPSAGNVPARISFVTGSNSTNLAERLKILNNGDIAFNNTDVVLKNATGRVGIGTAAPASPLDVVGGNWDVGTSEGDLRIGTATYRLKIGVATGGGGAGDVRIRAVGGTSRLLLGTGDALTINGTGNVGIGTITPTYKLSVNGTIQAKEVRVETGWADYVFEKDYKLQPLADVAKYIEQHKHLPGIASAKDVQEKGLAVGEMQTKMMEKIEELTLYVIDLQKQIAQLKAEKK